MPLGRKYLPYGLTSKERRSKQLQRKLSRCIRQVESAVCPARALRKNGTYNYKKCSYNPVAVCRSSILGKTKTKKKKRKK